jgi:hypothetical protein
LQFLLDRILLSTSLSTIYYYQDKEVTLMATHLRELTVIDDVADICDSISGALETDEKTKHLATEWANFTARADEQADAQKKLNRRLRRARTNIEVKDAIWDPEVAGAFGRAVVDASNGKRDIPPYTRFFKDHPPSEIRKMKKEDEVKFGNQAITELNRDPSEALAVTWIPRITAVNTELAASIDTKTKAEAEQVTLYQSRDLLIKEINKHLDVLEGDLQKIFPGDLKRVASYLTATTYNSEKKPEKKQEP